MRERVTIQRFVETTDAYGGVTHTWSDLRPCAARVRPVRGNESVPEGALASVQTYLVDIRYWPGLTTEDRLVWRGATLNIRSMENRDERRRYWTMECERGVNSE